MGVAHGPMREHTPAPCCQCCQEDASLLQRVQGPFWLVGALYFAGERGTLHHVHTFTHALSSELAFGKQWRLGQSL